MDIYLSSTIMFSCTEQIGMIILEKLTSVNVAAVRGHIFHEIHFLNNADDNKL